MLNDIMVFRGSFDDSVDTETARNITKCGSSVERISLMLRLDTADDAALCRELQKLLNRLYKTDLTASQEALEVVTRKAMGGGEVDRCRLLASVEGLFPV